MRVYSAGSLQIAEPLTIVVETIEVGHRLLLIVAGHGQQQGIDDRHRNDQRMKLTHWPPFGGQDDRGLVAHHRLEGIGQGDDRAAGLLGEVQDELQGRVQIDPRNAARQPVCQTGAGGFREDPPGRRTAQDQRRRFDRES